jgi:hypothetical protein
VRAQPIQSPLAGSISQILMQGVSMDGMELHCGAIRGLGESHK